MFGWSSQFLGCRVLRWLKAYPPPPSYDLLRLIQCLKKGRPFGDSDFRFRVGEGNRGRRTFLRAAG